MGTGFGGIILAGGRSTRFGRDKADEAVGGATLLQHTAGRLAQVADRLIIVCRQDQAAPPVNVPVGVRYLADELSGAGPLGGVLTALRISGDARCFVVACDMPLLQVPLLELLRREVEGYDGAVPFDAGGRPQPLCAIYSRSCVPAIERRIAEGDLRMSSFFDLRRIRKVPFEAWSSVDFRGLSFVNVNTEVDLARAATLLSTTRSNDGAGAADDHHV